MKPKIFRPSGPNTLGCPRHRADKWNLVPGALGGNHHFGTGGPGGIQASGALPGGPGPHLLSDMLTHSRTVPGWCGDEGEGELVIQKPPKHTEMKEN